MNKLILTLLIFAIFSEMVMANTEKYFINEIGLLVSKAETTWGFPVIFQDRRIDSSAKLKFQSDDKQLEYGDLFWKDYLVVKSNFERLNQASLNWSIQGDAAVLYVSDSQNKRVVESVFNEDVMLMLERDERFKSTSNSSNDYVFYEIYYTPDVDLLFVLIDLYEDEKNEEIIHHKKRYSQGGGKISMGFTNEISTKSVVGDIFYCVIKEWNFKELLLSKEKQEYLVDNETYIHNLQIENKLTELSKEFDLIKDFSSKEAIDIKNESYVLLNFDISSQSGALLWSIDDLMIISDNKNIKPSYISKNSKDNDKIHVSALFQYEIQGGIHLRVNMASDLETREMPVVLLTYEK